MYVLGGSILVAALFGLVSTLYYRSKGLLSPEWRDVVFWVTIGAGAFVRWLQILHEMH